MIHSFVRNYLHITWSSKERIKVFNSFRVRISVKNFILEKTKEIQIPVLSVNVQSEHIHLLVDLPSDICLADFVQKVKGSSSYWINQERLVDGRFSWQRGYGAFSVSASQLEIVKSYIINQDSHHKIKSFEEEYNEWKNNYGFFDD
ncbi:IS200/IS605 family transposase [Maribellus comscasis]|uniref:IS200/IS605 family transposase n=1 Tax=Maribellus comscasis TaxID=2681766 RepID=A0A6I6JY49_9BACT|nr:IS200/IS605 family transposase [Maribellus comscasis]QGY47955.1 IS200/IS605 family transposase [Maribellus comscasis]